MSSPASPEVVTQLGEADLESVFAIRHAVFVEEQGIPAELDRDGEDAGAIQVLIKVSGEAAATGRALVDPSGEAVLARIAVLPTHRGLGLGRLVVETLHDLGARAGAHTFVLHPHHYLESFYESLGYERTPGEETVAGHQLITMARRVGREG